MWRCILKKSIFTEHRSTVLLFPVREVNVAEFKHCSLLSTLKCSLWGEKCASSTTNDSGPYLTTQHNENI